ncbi:MAG TPA: DUF3017 domain-containing protein [Actinophytocola sp.]|uniref:DUF3017 domain-containing protein n=1 Tax=Actinophytocola sp. TaxID=1872138 RepID=UPI002DDCFA9A|nr:DUF3017 domain-containing protein [Actinophytocola sp.]HEV2777817.1 DUF3017 domain-containing protein [Actinophytocola sp.]
MRKHLPLILVLTVAVIGIVRIVQYYWRQGTVLIAVALILAAMLRAMLPNDRIGMVAIRGRGIDVLLYGGLGFAMLAVALTIQGGPLNQ